MPILVRDWPESGGRAAKIGTDRILGYTRKFIIESLDVPLMGPSAVLSALVGYVGGGIGTAYSHGILTDPWFEEDLAYITNIEVQETRDVGTWEGTVEYGALPGSEENPLDARPDRSWDGDNREVPIDIDKDGNAIWNSAYDPFNPAIQGLVSEGVFTITRNEATFSFANAALYQDSTNLDPFQGYDSYQWLMMPIKASEVWNSLIGFYVRVTYTIKYKRDGWMVRPLDAGFREIASGNKRNILVEGQKPSDPVPLDGLGVAQLTDTATPFYWEYQPYKVLDWAPLDLES
jgi:hypothetical protein